MNARLEHLPADVLGLGSIGRAALAAGVEFAPLPCPRRLAEIARPEERLGVGERDALVRHVRRGLEALGALPMRVETSLETLGREGTFCIVTGQQPGLLASPLYSLYKALQACRVATELARIWGAPVVPIFWNHADDHDVAEVNHAWIQNRNLDVQKIALAGMASGRTPVGELVLDDGLHRLPAVRAQLSDAIGEHPHADAALELLFPRAGETLARALTRAFTELLGEHGLVVVEPEWIRPLASSELGRLVSNDPVDALVRGEQELAAIGLEPAIPVLGARTAPDGHRGTSGAQAAALVYRHDPERGRLALRAVEGGFAYDDEPGSRTAAELGAEIVDRPSEWSAGALLRPIVQDAVFPVAAYIGGLGELGYHAQLGPARERAGLARTPFLTRVSCTLVDEDTRYALGRVEATVENVLRARGEHAPESDELSEPPVIAALRASGEDAAGLILAHRSALKQLEPALAITLKKTADHVRQSVGKVVDKATRVHRNRSGKGERQLRRVNNALFPRGLPQERVFGPLLCLARYGTAFVEALWRELPPLSSEHIVIQLEEESTE